MKDKPSRANLLNPSRPPNLQIPADTHKLLVEFCQKHPSMSMAQVVRAGLARFLPKLISGEMLLVNGKLVEKSELAAA